MSTVFVVKELNYGVGLLKKIGGWAENPGTHHSKEKADCNDFKSCERDVLCHLAKNERLTWKFV